MTGPYKFQTKMAVLNCLTRHFRIKFVSLGSLRVRLTVWLNSARVLRSLQPLRPLISKT